MSAVWYDENDHSLTLSGLKNGQTDAYISSATVAATFYDATGAPLAGITWPLPLSYVSGSNGDYRATVDQALGVAARDRITVKVTAVAGALDATWEEQLTVLKRRTL